MSFTSLSFIFLFLPVSLSIFYFSSWWSKLKIDHQNYRTSLLQCSMKRVFLTVCSIGFIFLLDKNTCYILLILTILSYFLKILLCKFRNRIVLGFSIIASVLPLFFCKYLSFFLGIFNCESTLETKIIVPIGLSFFTFRLLMILVDSYRGDIKCDFLEFISYILFFPQITSGPMDSPAIFLKWYQSDDFGVINFEKISDGITRIVIGMSKKVLIANTLSNIVDVCYQNRTEVNSSIAIIGILGYSLQIYFDFSGYSDMAVGIAELFGYSSVENFDSPYTAKTIGEFWKRWHISLTNFFTKYVYIPLGGNRRGKARTYLNIIIVFLVSGLWHGADWRYIIWGGIYGFILVFERMVGGKVERIPRVIGRTVTFIIVSLLWTLFRTETIDGAIFIVKEFFMFEFDKIPDALVLAAKVPEVDLLVIKCGVTEQIFDIWFWVVLLGSFVISQLPKNSKSLCDEKIYLKKPFRICLVILAVLCTLSFSQNSSFIYWKF